MGQKKPKFEVVDDKNSNLNRAKKFTPHDIISYQAKSPRQQRFLQLYKDNVKCIVLNGFPGTGKTFISLIESIRSVVDDSTHYEKVIFISSAVPSGQDVGYLKGTLEEKQAPYEEAAASTINDFMKYNGDSYKNLIALGKLEFRLDTHLRGLNFENAIVVVDEAQNFDYSSLKTIATRLCQTSRLIICGDEAQDDLKRKKKESGLRRFQRVLDRMSSHQYHATVTFEFDDIVRSDFCREFIIADFTMED